MVTLTEQMVIVKREIDYRKKLYPKWVTEKRISQQEADYQIEGMEYVYNSLHALLEFQRSFIAKNQKLFQ